MCVFRNYSFSELEGTLEIIYCNPLIIHRIEETLLVAVENPGGFPLKKIVFGIMACNMVSFNSHRLGSCKLFLCA